MADAEPRHQHVGIEELSAPSGGDHPVGRESPWAALSDLHARLGRLLAGTGGESAQPGGGWRPAADVEETDTAYRVEVELPGVDRDDVTVEFGGGELAVTGQVTQRERIGWWRTRTRPVGRFAYRVELPTDIDPAQVSATLGDGMLTVTVPKSANTRRRRIPIHT